MTIAKPPFSDAVRYFWNRRRRQKKRGTSDQGTRSAVTGGGHMDGFIKVLSKSLVDAGVKRSHVFTKRADTHLPGYFRASKNWDLVVARDSEILAVIELKSQVGSFGNNLNNRAEEALGNSEDLWTAYREGALGDAEPFLGFLYLIEEHPKSLSKIRLYEPRLPVMSDFKDASYADRLRILCQKLVLERKYSAACALMANPSDSKNADNYSELDPRHGALHFLNMLATRVGSQYD